VAINRADLVQAQAWLSVLRGARLAVQPGARWQTKQWPVGRFAAVAAKAYRQFGFSCVVVGGPEDKALGVEFESQLKRFVPAARVVNLVGRTSLTELAAVLLNVDAMLSNDSGPMHLAAALQVPVVGVFTCTDPVRSGPPPGVHELVSAPLACAGSYKKKCPFAGCRHLACFSALEVERVWQAFQRMAHNSLPRRVA
jgi:ADP-heptose:LPS heptosyltransferase